MTFPVGTKVLFHPRRGAARRGTIQYDEQQREKYFLILLDGDPYPVYTRKSQVTTQEGKMTTTNTTEGTEAAPAKRRGRPRKTEAAATKTPAKAPAKASRRPKSTKATTTPKTEGAATSRRRKTVDITTRKTTVAAGAKTAAKASARATAKATAPVAKRGRPKGSVEDHPLENPFRAGTNAYHYTEILKEGGQRSKMVRKVKRKVSVAPWKGEENYVDVDREIDKRLILTANKLAKDYGFKLIKGGRGPSGTLQVVPPKRRPRAKA